MLNVFSVYKCVSFISILYENLTQGFTLYILYKGKFKPS